MSEEKKSTRRGRIADMPPPDPRKDPLSKLFSAWIITVNTNSAKREVIKPFREAWEHIRENMGTFMVGRPGGELQNVRERHAFERGPLYHKIHLHSKLVVESTGLVYVDPFLIKKYVDKYIEEKVPTFAGCYVNVSVIRNYNAARYVEEYLDKEPMEEVELE